mgnify:CR=1 FL=1
MATVTDAGRTALDKLLATKRRCMAADCQRPALYAGAFTTCVCGAHKNENEDLRRLSDADAIGAAEAALAETEAVVTTERYMTDSVARVFRVAGQNPMLLSNEESIRVAEWMAEALGARVVRR